MAELPRLLAENFSRSTPCTRRVPSHFIAVTMRNRQLPRIVTAAAPTAAAAAARVTLTKNYLLFLINFHSFTQHINDTRPVQMPSNKISHVKRFDAVPERWSKGIS